MSGDPDLRRMLEEVCREDDRQREEFERREYLREQKKQAQQRERGELVRKVYDPAQVRQSAQADAVVDQKINAAITRYHERLWAKENGTLFHAIAETISLLRREWRDEIRKEIAGFKLPVMEGWTPRFYTKGAIVLAGGGVYQAREDTAHALAIVPGIVSLVLVSLVRTVSALLN
jgi:hypothetical protein